MISILFFRLNSGHMLELILKMTKFYNVQDARLLLSINIIWSIIFATILAQSHSSVTNVTTHA